MRFGSWIGGDRDGHPGVTHEITEQTVVWLRNSAIEFQLKACSDLFESLSLSQRQLDFGPELNSGIYAACHHWPTGTFGGSLRLTEQGEVLADRYDDPSIGYRHLEQLVWSSLLASGEAARGEEKEWLELMQRLSGLSLKAYHELVDQPGFVEFFRKVTPITEIERLPIGSRPSRRTGSNSLTDLRAIPWVFSWTQCRCLIPAWFGLGSAATTIFEEKGSLQLLQKMYRKWPYFRATMENAELALAKADLDIADQYAELADSSETLERVKKMVASEVQRTRKAVSAITGVDELLDGTPWLKESIRVRNRYIDPLNPIQIELLQRLRKCPEEMKEQYEELQHLTRLTIKGIAAGMRTTG